MKRKVFEVRLSGELGHEFQMPMPKFDALVDGLFDDILIITPNHRYVVSLDDFLDYGSTFDDGEMDFMVIGKAYIGRA